MLPLYVCPLRTFDPVDRFSRNFVWTLRHGFQLFAFSNNNMADARECEIGGALFVPVLGFQSNFKVSDLNLS